MKYELVFIVLLISLAGCTSSGDLPETFSSSALLDGGDKGLFYSLTLDEAYHSFVQGSETAVYAFNNSVPGPLIEGVEGEEITVEITNDLDVPTSIHWHGILLKNKMDGVPYVTQEPIEPGKSKEYRFLLREPGLYWYHSHLESHEQVEKGAQGAFLIRPKNESEQVYTDNEVLLVLDDVLLNDLGQFRPFNLGRMHGRFGNHIIVNGKDYYGSSIQGSSTRLRIVNTANARSFDLFFGGRDVTVIGEGIGRVEPYNSSYFTINPGERYDVIIHSDKDETIDVTHMNSRDRELLARLDVEVPPYQPRKTEVSYEPDNPFSESVYSREPDFQVDLRGFMERGELRWAINDKLHPEDPEEFEVKEGDVVKMRITNTQGQPHPMHLHGQKFAVLSRNGVREERFVWRDTVMLGSQDTVDIAFKAQEKGTWTFHCHILEHSEAGMVSYVEVV